MKKILLLLLLSICTGPLFAHVGGHGTPTKTWAFTNGTKSIQADFVIKEGETVYLSNENREILLLNMTDFIKEDQRRILEKTNWISALGKATRPRKH